jgi:hypothetical protein
VGLIAAAAAVMLLTAATVGADHKPLPLNEKVVRTTAKVLRLGYGKDVSFKWSIFVSDRSKSKAPRRVCFSVNLFGPLAHLASGVAMGPEVGGRGCGPIKFRQGAIVAMPIPGGSVTEPSGETESWQSFDVGVAAYRPNVDHVRLIFSDGIPEMLNARVVPSRVAFAGTEPFQYVVFAFNGCVERMEGFAKGKVVATFKESAAECEGG